VTIRTTGDRLNDRALAALGGKGLFTKELEDALLAGTIDCAVHSAKDMPTVLPAGLVIAAYLPREDVRDVFISRKASTLRDLPVGAVIGTASLRRRPVTQARNASLIARLRSPAGTLPRSIQVSSSIITLMRLLIAAGAPIKRSSVYIITHYCVAVTLYP